MKAGDRAPDFTRTSHGGATIHLASILASKNVVLFFYPRDFTPVCTAQVCAFRDAYETFEDAGAEVIGVSSDDEGSHQKFSTAHRLPFTLLSDADGSLRALYEVPKAMFLFPGRTTYVIDRSGVVRDVFTAHLGSDVHVKQALDVLGKL